MNIDEANELVKKTGYYEIAVEKEVHPIDLAYASAFFMEGYNHALGIVSICNKCVYDPDSCESSYRKCCGKSVLWCNVYKEKDLCKKETVHIQPIEGNFTISTLIVKPKRPGFRTIEKWEADNGMELPDGSAVWYLSNYTFQSDNRYWKLTLYKSFLEMFSAEDQMNPVIKKHAIVAEPHLGKPANDWRPE